MRYGLLIAPASNRVYAASASALTLAELGVINDTALGGALADLATTRLGSVDYVTFECGELGTRELSFISNLSSLFALFVIEQGKLTPVDLSRSDRFDSDLVSIQKYSGKTNEHFTKLLLNVALCASRFAGEFPGRKFSVLDPLCGRGTTLNQALMYGFDGAGVEIERTDFEAYTTFIQRWVKDKRLKHQANLGRVRGHRRLHLTVGADKASYKAGSTLSLTCVNADTLQTAEVLPPRSFDLIVTDAPYGVQHESKRTAQAASRRPLDLLSDALPVWLGMLRPGGALGLSWNTHVAPRARLAEVVASSGFAVCDGAPFRAFEHRVDQAILRDVIVATKPA
jgi:SAM-dependent methyltransferase